MLRMTASVMTMILMRLTTFPPAETAVRAGAAEGCILSAQNRACQRLSVVAQGWPKTFRY